MQLVPSANNTLAPIDSGAPKKRKMNLKWDDSQDIFTKAEGMKPLTAEDILAFNRNYEDSLAAQEQKVRDAQDKLDKKRAQFSADAGNKLKTPQGAPTLQRGTFKRGEEVKKENPPVDSKETDKTQQANSKQPGNQDSKSDGNNKKGNDPQQNQQAPSKKKPRQKKENQPNGKDPAQPNEPNAKSEPVQKGNQQTPKAEGEKSDQNGAKKLPNEQGNNKGKKNQQNAQASPQNEPQPGQPTQSQPNQPKTNQNGNLPSKKEPKKTKDTQAKPDNAKAVSNQPQSMTEAPEPTNQIPTQIAGTDTQVSKPSELAPASVKPVRRTLPLKIESFTPDNLGNAKSQITNNSLEQQPVDTQPNGQPHLEAAHQLSNNQAPHGTFVPQEQPDNFSKTTPPTVSYPASISADPAISAIKNQDSTLNPNELFGIQGDHEYVPNALLVDQAIANPQVVRPRVPLQLPTGSSQMIDGSPGTPQRMHPHSPMHPQHMMNQMNMPMPNMQMQPPRGPQAKGPNSQRAKGQRIVAPPGMQMPDNSPQGGMFFPPQMPDFYDPAFHPYMHQGGEFSHPGQGNPNFYHQDPVYQDPALFYMQGPHRAGPPMYSPPSPRGYEQEDPRFFAGYPGYGAPPQAPMFPQQFFHQQKGPVGYPPGLHPNQVDPRRPVMGPGGPMGQPGLRGPPGMQMPHQQQPMYLPGQMSPQPGMMRGPQNAVHPGGYPGQNYPMMHGAIPEEELLKQFASMDQSRAMGAGAPGSNRKPANKPKRAPLNVSNQGNQGPN